MKNELFSTSYLFFIFFINIKINIFISLFFYYFWAPALATWFNELCIMLKRGPYMVFPCVCVCNTLSMEFRSDRDEDFEHF